MDMDIATATHVAATAAGCRMCWQQPLEEQLQCRHHWMRLTPEVLAYRHADALDAWRCSGDVHRLMGAGWQLVRTTAGRHRGPEEYYLFSLPGGGFCQVSTFANAANGWHYSVGQPRKWRV